MPNEIDLMVTLRLGARKWTLSSSKHAIARWGEEIVKRIGCRQKVHKTCTNGRIEEDVLLNPDRRVPSTD